MSSDGHDREELETRYLERQYLERQRKSWRSGSPLRLNDLLRDAPSPDVAAELWLDCIYAEFRFRIDNGESASLTDYGEGHPSLRHALADLEDVHRSAVSSSVPSGSPSDRYHVQEAIGRGGMASVYRALDTERGTAVALKVLHSFGPRDESTYRRFAREIEALTDLDVDGVVTLLDASLDSDTPFLVTELLGGTDLRAWLEEHSPLPISVACEITSQAAAALGELHERGWVHRDIKPGNLQIEETGTSPTALRVSILDLGMAKFVEAAQEDALTSSRDLLGTIDYVAPEQVEAAEQVSSSADIFSLGCTLFELLTGRKPWDGGSIIARLVARTATDAPLVTTLRSDVPPKLSELVSKMLERDPRKRTLTAKDISSQLRAVVIDVEPVAIHQRPARTLRHPILAPSRLRPLLSWAATSGDLKRACRLALPLAGYWIASDQARDGLETLEVLSHERCDQRPLDRANVHLAAASLALAEDDDERADSEYRAALAEVLRSRTRLATTAVLSDLSRTRPPEPHRLDGPLGPILNEVGNLFFDRGDLESAQECYEEAVGSSQAHGQNHNLAHHLLNLSRVEFERGNLSSVEDLSERAAHLYLQETTRSGTAMTEITKGSVLCEQRRLDEAEALFRSAQDAFRSEQDFRGVAVSWNNLAHAAFLRGDAHEAAQRLRLSESLCADADPLRLTISLSRARFAIVNDDRKVARHALQDAFERSASPDRPLRRHAVLQCLVELLARDGDLELAAELLAALDRDCAKNRWPRPQRRRDGLDDTLPSPALEPSANERSSFEIARSVLH
ncbi:MAG: protein kinase [Planctomycetota bacterium]